MSSAALGGLSWLANNDPALSALVGVNSFEVITAIIEDTTDGRLDGLNLAGGTVFVGPGSSALPCVDPTGLAALVTAINAYASSVPSLSGVSANPLGLDFAQLLTPIIGGTGVVQLSGPGASALPVTEFVVTEVAELSEDIHFFNMQLTEDARIKLSISEGDTPGGLLRTIGFGYLTSPSTLAAGWQRQTTGEAAGVTRNGNTYTLEGVILESITGAGGLTLNGFLTYQ